MAITKTLVTLGHYKAVDLDLWSSLTPRAIRQVRSRQVEFARMGCPKCATVLLVPLDRFTVKHDGSIVSDNPIHCAHDSKAHDYFGGCGHSFQVLRTRAIPKRRA